MCLLFTLASLCITIPLLRPCGDSSHQGDIIENWTYNASDGTVIFILITDKITTTFPATKKLIALLVPKKEISCVISF